MELEYNKAKDLWRGVLDLTGTTQMYLGIGSDSQRYKTAVTHNKEIYNDNNSQCIIIVKYIINLKKL